MRRIHLERNDLGTLVCRHDPGYQNHGDMIEFIFPDNSTVLVRVLDCGMMDLPINCTKCPFFDMRCPVIMGPGRVRTSLCRASCVYEKVGSSMEEL